MHEDDAVPSACMTPTLLSTLFAKLTTQEIRTEAAQLVGQSLLLRSNVLVADAHQLAVASNIAIATRMAMLLCILLGSLGPLLGACVFIGMAHRRLLRSLAALHEGAAALGLGHLTRHPRRWPGWLRTWRDAERHGRTIAHGYRAAPIYPGQLQQYAGAGAFQC